MADNKLPPPPRMEDHEHSPHRPLSIQQTRSREDPPLRSPLSNSAASPPPAPPGFSLHRFDSLPLRGSASRNDDGLPDTRRRGRTVSARSREPPQVSPHSLNFRRNGSSAAPPEEHMGTIPESRRASAEIPRRDGPPESAASVSEFPRFSAEMRPRVGTWTGSQPRRATVNRRPSIAVAAMTTGREADAQSSFTLAGPAIDTVAANQAYVHPGYTQLNPAYDNPINARPVWGLAKPLPRVIRPGMIPTRSELNIRDGDETQPPQDENNVDLEQGSIEPTLNIRKITSQLQNTRQQREDSLIRSYSINRAGRPRATSSLGRGQSSLGRVVSRQSEAIQEQQGLDGYDYRERVSSSQPPDIKEELGLSSQQDDKKFPQWYPDDAASAATEHELDGDENWINQEILPTYDAETEEVHNLHTHWSVIRLRYREPLAELLAVSFDVQ
jgi:aquaglyceroporin related protein